MLIAGTYSLKEGEKVVKEKYPVLYGEIIAIIDSINAEEHKTKRSKERTMTGRMLYSPKSLNQEFKKNFFTKGWVSHKVNCKYSQEYYSEKYIGQAVNNAYREMDFVKEKLGVEVQFGKYAFMVYNVCAKMTIFNNLGVIDTGVEIVPVKRFADTMSTGVSYYEQLIWDLEHRGIADIDIPVLIIGIDK